ncbi:2-C-methyl-D-erythritol 4-phosphate cytidylyltransferase [Aquihabitans sp. G128]|uniref:2-C-methyl-D-erythritol 4-phosphate cytidylyltransferase n=1 Tax=Aquihabitans sp. G128 TaxID=2849779 RepID=UPI001C24A315|nr:2-C-methyl-D-erythritol 4-phosphate cytidylyltransferase [Aquihabitans sp. G128]QXC59247.1 2-C-methyl-D-erythritol 4-phosphate cytidylyltransferase [Aquihabitans sp. G128]
MSGAPLQPAAPVWVVLVAAGSGQRFGAAKQYAPLAGRRVLDWSIDVARSVADGIVLVVPHADAGDPEPAVDVVVAGGDTRSGSVRAGLTAVPADAAVVLVHDGARPLATHALFRAVVDAVLAGADAAVPVTAVVDTVCDSKGGPVDRDGLRAVQTPQGFGAEALRRVHAGRPEATDDASLVAAGGGRLRLVQGERWNLKITEPDDLLVAEALLESR